MRALVLLTALIPTLALAEAPLTAPPPDARPAAGIETPRKPAERPERGQTEAPRKPEEKPANTLLPADLAVRPAARPTPPKPPGPAAKPGPPTTAATLDWERQVRDALTPDVAPAPPTPHTPPEVDTIGHAPPVAPRPRKRPAGIGWSGPAAAVCKDPRLAGEAVAPIDDEGACGIPKPVRLTGVAGVALTTPVYLGCPAALALADWVAKTAASAPDLLNARVSSISPFASYACRNRNGRAGGKLSEHARGRAVDIGRFGLSDGRSVTVKEGWRDPKTSGFLKRAWRDACGRFGTVLGPGADIHHQDHFHLDVAKHRGGAYCQ